MSDPERRTPDDIAEAIADLKRQLEAVGQTSPQRIDCTAENVEQGLAKLVLSLIELLRRLLERQAIRRMEGGGLSDEQVEEMGLALMRLETKIHEMAKSFGIKPEELNLDLGPLGNLLDK